MAIETISVSHQCVYAMVVWITPTFMYTYLFGSWRMYKHRDDLDEWLFCNSSTVFTLRILLCNKIENLSKTSIYIIYPPPPPPPPRRKICFT